MSNERIAALEAIDVTAVDALKALKAEQDVLGERLQQLEEKRGAVAEPVYLRVRGDYETRSRELEQKAQPLKQQARSRYAELSSLLERYTGDHEAITLDRQEIELRHQLGEFDKGEFEQRIAKLESELAARSEALERARELKARFLEAFHSEEELQAPAAAVAAPVAAAPPAPPAAPAAAAPAAPPAAASAATVAAPLPPIPPAASAATVPSGLRTLEADLASDQTQVLPPLSALPPLPPVPPAPPVPPPAAVPAAKPSRPPSETQIMPVLDIPLPARNSATPAAASGATVVVRAARLVPQNPEAGKNSVVLGLNSVSIGADGNNEVRVGGPGVDARHAQLTVSMAGYTVVDLGSPHGTRVNAEKIRERLLRDQDVIQIGAARWVFREG
ncbi:FHA domain-containing protein [Tahibacter harae]|uniref:FHA domain-containing protein n=1 Tax=Tahibacter harae TaxID=2963937 RepID=A0ABT1QPE9_9GAMM|nr:FHA domain-containing protein [Tahibacter harae]MCQ4164163.1 FHA domain-containing protein [Tahibacter harae]